MATTTHMARYEVQFGAWRAEIGYKLRGALVFYDSITLDAAGDSDATWKDWFFPLESQDGSTNPHYRRRRTRTWSRNQ